MDEDPIGELFARDELEYRPSLADEVAVQQDITNLMFREPKDDDEAEEKQFWERDCARPMDPRVEHIHLVSDAMRFNEEQRNKKNPKKKKKKKRKSSQTKLKKHGFSNTKLTKLPEAEKENIDDCISPAPKKRRKSVGRNFQGFSLEKCCFIEHLGKHCYLPPKYYGKQFDPNDLDDPEYFCGDCYLGPCIIVEKRFDLESAFYFKANGPDIFNLPDGVEKNKLLSDFMSGTVEKMMGEIFTPAYAKRTGMPRCVKQLLLRSIGPTRRYYSKEEVDKILESSDEEDNYEEGDRKLTSSEMKELLDSEEEDEFGSVDQQLRKFAAHEDE